MSPLKTLAALAAISLALGTMASQPADARERSRTGVISGPGGKSATIDRTVNRSTGSRAVNSTITGPGGATASRSTNATRTAPGEWRTEGVATGPRGNTRTTTGTATRTETGVSASGTVTGQRGTAAYSGQRARTDDGFTRSGSVTGPNGRTATREIDVSRDGTGGAARTVTSTGPGGETRTRTQQVAPSLIDR